MASASPDTTTDAGPFTAATPTTPGRHSASSATTCASLAPTASIAPPDGSSPINRARAATRATAPSNENTPATYAAVIPPSECPSTTSGCGVQERHNRYNATSNANNTGCTTPVSVSPSASP
ncbi:hypothetical protein VM95_33075, partial [Streptomyces rubellomurinus]